MTISIKLLGSDREIERKINIAIADELNALVNKKHKVATRRIQSSIEGWIRTQPEIASLESEGIPGTLNAQLGLYPGQATLAVSDIVNSIISTIDVKIRPIDNKLRGGVDFSIQPEYFRNLLGIPSGFVVALSGPLHWLNWLLLEGTSTIVYGFSYVPDFSGRSGGGTMTGGGAWRIPPIYAGTESDNFVTRALTNKDRELSTILGDIFR